MMTAAPPSLQAFVFLLNVVAVWTWSSGWALVPGDGVEFVSTASATYAVRANTKLAGAVLVQGDLNLQPSPRACAESCNRAANCSSFNFCNIKAGCLADPSGARHPQNACSLLSPMMTLMGLATFQMASDNPDFGLGGLKLTTADPGPQGPCNGSCGGALDGYSELPARSIIDEYNLACNGTVMPGMCTLPLSREEARDYCDAMPGCQAFVYAPQGRSGGFSSPLASFKGSGTPGELLDLRKSSLTPLTFLYVKEGQLSGGSNAATPAEGSAAAASMSPTESESVGLSAGAIAGIVLGCICSLCMVVIAGALLGRHICTQHSSQGDADKQGSGAGKKRMQHENGSQQRVCSSGAPTGNASDQAPLSHLSEIVHEPDTVADSTFVVSCTSADLAVFEKVLGLQAWKDVVIPRESIEFCHTESGELTKLGSGFSGQVYRAAIGGTPCAVKVFQFQQGASSHRHFLQEARMLSQLRHPSILQFMGVALDPGKDEGMLITELMEGGDLGARMNYSSQGSSERSFGWYQRGKEVALSVATGLAYLHERKVVHLDLKPRNVLLSRFGEAKVADVGFSKVMHRDCLSLRSERLGTFNYVAPEVLLGESSNEKVDIYSYGIMLWELCTGEVPRRGTLRLMSVPDECPPEVARLQQRCILHDQALRPSAAEIVELLQSLQRSSASAGSCHSASGRATSPEQRLVSPRGRAALPESRGLLGGPITRSQHVLRAISISQLPVQSPMALSAPPGICGSVVRGSSTAVAATREGNGDGERQLQPS